MPGYSVSFTVVDNATKQIDLINRRIAAMHAPIERMSRSVQKFIDVSGLRKIADGFDWIARAAGTVVRSLSAIVPVLGTIVGAATITGMVKLVSSFAAWGNQLKTNADQIGISADQLQKWQDATTRAGGNAQDMTETLLNLHKISADAFTGMNNEAAAYFKRFGISLTDANGHLKSTTQLLPEVFKALDSLKDPADRSRVAAALLGDAQAKLYEEYKQSGKPLQDWLREEEDHKRLTEAQLEQLNRYRLAQASLGTTFDQLGRQIAAVLANNFTPFLQHLDDFVQKNQPAIIAAIDNISKQFAAWLEKPETWKSFEDGARAVLDSLVWITQHLGEIKTAAEGIAVMFAAQWAVGIVTSIASVTTALGVAGGIAGGIGLLGGLGAVAALVLLIIDHWKDFGQIGKEIIAGINDEVARVKRNLSDFLSGKPGRPEDMPKPGETPMYPTPAPFTPGGAWAPPTTPQAAPGGAWAGIGPGAGPPRPAAAPAAPFTGTQSEFYQQTYNDLLDAAKAKGVANPEVVAKLGASQASLETGYGKHVVGNNLFGIKAGGGVGTGSVAAMTGEHIGGQDVTMSQNFAAFGSNKESAAGYVDFLQRNPRYKDVLGAKSDSEALAALGKTGYATDPNYTGKLGSIEGRYGATQLAQAPPAAPPAAAPPVNGAVSVDITHRNPPPDASVTAQGSGAVNVAPPRIEHPQLDFTTA